MSGRWRRIAVRETDGQVGQAVAAAPATLSEADLEAELRALFPGGVPNLYRGMARNPRVLRALIAVKRELADGVLSPAERCLVAIEVARHVDCRYCLSALGTHGRTDLGIAEETLAAQAADGLPADARLAAVVRAARALIASQGRLGRAELHWFAERGLDTAALLEILGVIAEYTLATHAANLDRTRIDPDYRSS
jgi:AhpD family alkylhydroperoxidase